MAILKSINENFNNWKNSDFLQPSILNDKQQELDSEKGLEEWIEIGPELRIAKLPEDSNNDVVYQCWLDIKKSDTPKKKEDKCYYILIVNGDWENRQLEIYEQLVDTNNYMNWLGLFEQKSGKIINPFESLESNLWERIRQGKKRRALREIKRMTHYEPMLQYLLKDRRENRTREEMLSQAKIKTDKLQNWMERLKQAKMWDDDERILDMAHIRLNRNHYSVNSNFNKSGKLIVTNKKLVFAKQSFSLFGFGLAALIPLIVFARPANKIIALGRVLVQYLKVPFQAIRPIISASWPAIAVTVVSLNFINISAITNFFNNLFDHLPSLSLVVPTVSFMVKNPWTIATFGGFYTFFRWGILKLFFRKEKLIILPHDQLEFVIATNREIIGRWKVKGSQTVRAKDGIEYRVKIRSYDKTISNQRLAQQIQLHLLENSPTS